MNFQLGGLPATNSLETPYGWVCHTQLGPKRAGKPSCLFVLELRDKVSNGLGCLEHLLPLLPYSECGVIVLGP